ncbi:MAG: DUF1800 domain-containing protein [Opitutus sp.]|nr:DUF1800 domain-containing protein [Opitutus sp.]
MNPALTPAEAWQPLPPAEWNAEAARHLLRRAGWTARPDEIDRAVRSGLAATLDLLFPPEPVLLMKPRMIARLEADAPRLVQNAQQMMGDDKLRAQRETQERSRLAVQDLSIKWLQFAAQPESAAFAKWVLFLSDVYVVSAEKVKNAALLYDHFDLITRHALGPAPALTKAVSRSPAMVQFLDLNQSQRKAPNENFARELFELFVLGEGNYTEPDIKEAARAFTGYRAQPFQNTFRYVPAQHDGGMKTIFGQNGTFTGDDVIDLAYRQNAAGTFLPHEMVKFYLSDTPLPPEYLAPLGDTWRSGGYELRLLARHFFGSRIFFAPEFRGNFIKSPVQLYVGLVQDLKLDVAPLPRFTLNPLRQMGQWLYSPPNVRGWVGGRNWINSATLAARRQLVEMLFTPIDENSLNADELIDLVAARTNGATHFSAPDGPFSEIAKLETLAATDQLLDRLLGQPVAPELRESVRQFLASAGGDGLQRTRRVRRAAVTVLQSPAYQLC